METCNTGVVEEGRWPDEAADELRVVPSENSVAIDVPAGRFYLDPVEARGVAEALIVCAYAVEQDRP